MNRMKDTHTNCLAVSAKKKRADFRVTNCKSVTQTR
jgi:hypothetical protein